MAMHVAVRYRCSREIAVTLMLKICHKYVNMKHELIHQNFITYHHLYLHQGGRTHLDCWRLKAVSDKVRDLTSACSQEASAGGREGGGDCIFHIL